jgi:hypothetical protein
MIYKKLTIEQHEPYYSRVNSVTIVTQRMPHVVQKLLAIALSEFTPGYSKVVISLCPSSLSAIVRLSFLCVRVQPRP